MAWFVFGSLLLGAGRGLAEEDGKLSAQITERMGRFVADKEIAGAVTLVGRSDQILSLVAVGQQNVEDHLPMRPDTMFRIASMTKPITGIGVMMLVEAGKLALDDTVEKHLPDFRGQMMVASKSDETLSLSKPARLITLRDLLTHTSGLPDTSAPGPGDLTSGRDKSLATATSAYAKRPLSFEPGSRWSYSNAGINTLGRIIEVASGQPYEVFLTERLFHPLGMVDTTFYPSDDQAKRVAVTYDRKEGELRPVATSRTVPKPGERMPSPAGGLYSTAADLALLYQMMLNRGTVGTRRLLTEATIIEMTSLQTKDLKTGFTDGMGFGLGWGFVRQPEGVTESLSPGSFGHGGAFGTQAWIDPKRGTFVLLLIQRVGLANSDASDIRRELQRIAVGKP